MGCALAFVLQVRSLCVPCYMFHFQGSIFGESLVVRLYSEIDQIHLSIEAQCVSHHLPLVDCHNEYEQAKKKLEEAYNTIAEEELRYKIGIIEDSHVNRQHGKAWKLVNEISGRRTTQRGQIHGDTQQERVENLYKHFLGLLGSEPEAIDADLHIPPILEDLEIPTSNCTEISLKSLRRSGEES